MKEKFFRYIAAVGITVILAGCGAAPVSDGVESPKESEKLTVYTAHKEEVYRPVIEEFEDRTGIWVDVQAGGTTEMLRRIRQESGGTSEDHADIMFGGGAENLETFREYFSSYHSSLEEYLDPRFVSEDGLWTPFTELPIVFVYNNKLVSNEDAPRRWKEFLDGTWEGQISFADPEKSGTSITILETFRFVNEKEGWYEDDDQILADFAENLSGHMAAGSGQVLTEVASGEKMVGITLEETALKEMAKGSDISMRYPDEGTSAVPDGIAVVSGAPHLDNARRFVDFVIDTPVQKYVETNMYRRSVRTDVKETVRGTDSLNAEDVGTLQVLDFDVRAASSEEQGVLEQFLQYVQDAGDQS